MAELNPKLSLQDVISLVKENQQVKQNAKNALADAREAIKDAEAREKLMSELEKELDAE